MVDPSAKIHESAYVGDDAEIGANTAVWHFCHVMSGAKVGPDCSLGHNVVISPGVTLGRGVRVQNNVTIYTGVECGDYVFVGPAAVFTNVINPRSAIPRKDEYRATPVGEHASIGANVTIVCGHRIGAYSLIGAGAVVTREVPDYALVTGNPARVRGWVSRAGHKLSFDAAGQAVCPETGERYRLQGDHVTFQGESSSKP